MSQGCCHTEREIRKCEATTLSSNNRSKRPRCTTISGVQVGNGKLDRDCRTKECSHSSFTEVVNQNCKLLFDNNVGLLPVVAQDYAQRLPPLALLAYQHKLNFTASIKLLLQEILLLAPTLHLCHGSALSKTGSSFVSMGTPSGRHHALKKAATMQSDCNFNLANTNSFTQACLPVVDNATMTELADHAKSCRGAGSRSFGLQQ